MDNQTSSNSLPDHCRSLFLGDLSCFCSEQDVYNFFRPYGEIQTIRVMRGKQNKALGYGFVTYVDLQCAMKALALDGELLLGRPIKVGWANVRSPIKQQYNPQAQKAKPQFFNQTAQVHFSFISKQHDHVVTEQNIREVFEQYAEVADVSVKKSSVDPATNEQNGYGFVHFPLTDAGILGAIRAAKSLHQVFINNVLYDCCLTWSLEAIIQQKYNLQALPGSSSAHRHGQQPQGLSPHGHSSHHHHAHQPSSDRSSPSNQMAMMNNYMNRPHLVASVGSIPMANASPKFSRSNPSPMASRNNNKPPLAPFTFEFPASMNQPSNSTTTSSSPSSSSGGSFSKHHHHHHHHHQGHPFAQSSMDFSSCNSSTSSQQSDHHHHRHIESHRPQQLQQFRQHSEDILLFESMQQEHDHDHQHNPSSHVFSFLEQSHESAKQVSYQPLSRGMMDLIDLSLY